MPMPFAHRRTRPRISVNKLGEYLAENKASRRLAILREQKQPVRCRVIRYTAACRAIVAALTAPGDPQSVLAEHLEDLKRGESASAASEFTVREGRLCREAIRSFVDILPTLDLNGLKVESGRNDVPKLHQAGVEISVRPELVLRGNSRRGQPVVGAIKLHFPKSHPLDQEAGDYVGAILHQYGELHLAGPEACDPRFCFVIDIATRRIWTAPRNFLRRRSEVLAACREIAIIWNAI